RGGHSRSRGAWRAHRDPLRVDRQGGDHQCRAACPDRPGDGALHLATGVGDARSLRQRDRWLAGPGHGGHRRVDLRARRLLPRSQLEIGRNRSRAMISARGARSAALAVCLWAGSPAWAAGPGSLKFPEASLEPSAWGQLDGWTADDLRVAYATFLLSCRAILAESKPAPAGRRLTNSMKGICRRAKDLDPANDADARAFFEANFMPLHIAKVGDPPGFLTGYYEPIVAGSRFPTPEYAVPIYRRPGDLVAAGAKKKGQLSNKGKVYRKVGRKRVPYYTRAEIEDGALDGRHLEICWVRDPIDAFFTSIQGSARIQLEDGATLRINYDAHNGHRYLPVGRILIDRGEVSKEEMSMERIRQWMLARPEEGRELRRMNDS